MVERLLGVLCSVFCSVQAREEPAPKQVVITFATFSCNVFLHQPARVARYQSSSVHDKEYKKLSDGIQSGDRAEYSFAWLF